MHPLAQLRTRSRLRIVSANNTHRHFCLQEDEEDEEEGDEEEEEEEEEGA